MNDTVPHPFLPTLEHAFSIEITLQPSMRVEPSPWGSSRVAVYIESGVISGPLLNGRVLPMTGGDWAQLRPDGVIDFDARYMLELDDGSIVYMQNRGYRWASPEAMAKQARREEVPFSEYYMRVSPKFEVKIGVHDWLTKHVFVGVAEKIPTGNRIHYFVVR
jgi:hypothetical protein